MNIPFLSRKVILVGGFGVGKTSLIRQYVHQIFTDEYLVTIGVKVDKKVVQIEDKQVSMILWDIAGEVSMQKINHSYYLGANGIIYVMDLSRPSTFERSTADVNFFRQLLPKSKLLVVGNKTDLLTDSELKEIQAKIPVTCDFFTSAKNGTGLEDMFYKMASSFIE
jgi:small GTP-binding protein